MYMMLATDNLSNENSLSNLISNSKNGDLVKILNKLGRLSDDFDHKPLIGLLGHDSDKVRTLAVKNLAKLSNSSLLNVYVDLIQNDESSTVRREAASQ